MLSRENSSRKICRKKRKQFTFKVDLKAFFKDEFDLPKTMLDLMCPDILNQISLFLEEKDIQNLNNARKIILYSNDLEIFKDIEQVWDTAVLTDEDVKIDNEYNDFQFPNIE